MISKNKICTACLLLLPLSGQAQNCKDLSGAAYLDFIGEINKTGQTVWLSLVRKPGDYRLSFANDPNIDTWSERDITPFFNFSRSPYNSKGNGQTHKLINDDSGSILCTQNQKDSGWDFDYGSLLPPLIPERPEKPVQPIEPEPTNPIEPPDGPVNPDFVRPVNPIEPGPVNPIEPGPVNPIEPGPVNPIEPGPVNPIEPGPVNPIEPGPVNPIEPGPVNPIEPGPVNPIEPPDGPVDPDFGRPVNPIEPGPINPIEPGPVNPIEPGPVNPIEPGPVNPIEPPGTVNPERPVGKNEVDNLGVSDAFQCPDNLTTEQMLLDKRYQQCIQDTKAGGVDGTGGAGGDKSLPALTEGREFDAGKPWNVWANASITRSTNSRFPSDIDTDSGVVAVGIDTLVGEDVIAGVIVNMESNETDGFGSLLQLESDGYNIGPYFAWYLDEKITMDVSVMYGWLNNSVRLGPYEGDFDSEKLTTLINLNSQFITEDDIEIKPRLSFEFTRTEKDAYELKGPENIFVKKSTSKDSSISIASEFSKQYFDENALITEPIFSLKATYRVDQWSSGSTNDPWTGEVRAGVRKQISDISSMKADLGYGAIGQDDVTEWSASIFWSYQF